MPRNMKALVLWTKEVKTGIEPIKNVPESARFPGALSSVRFSGDKKWYPAKILAIGDSQTELELHAEEVEKKIMEDKEKEKLPSKRSRGTKNKPPLPSVASDRSIAQALGTRRPMPNKQLEETKKVVQRANKVLKDAAMKGQSALEANVASSVRKNLMASLSESMKASTTPTLLVNSGDDSESDDYGDEGHFDQEESAGEDMGNGYGDHHDSDESDQENQDNHDGDAKEAASVWCSSCEVCDTLQKYDNVCYYSFLKDLLKFYEKSVSQEGKKQYLKLKPIPEGLKRVELRKDSGIWICSETKNQLRVDFKNKPSILLRETLYALYGEETFRTCKVTGRGNVEGTFTLAPDVLAALRSFVNKNIPKEQSLKINQLVAIINKRAPEWRKSPYKKQARQANRKKLPSVGGVISTSPFKAAPLVATIPPPVESNPVNSAMDQQPSSVSTTDAAIGAFPPTTPYTPYHQQAFNYEFQYWQHPQHLPQQSLQHPESHPQHFNGNENHPQHFNGNENHPQHFNSNYTSL